MVYLWPWPSNEETEEEEEEEAAAREWRAATPRRGAGERRHQRLGLEVSKIPHLFCAELLAGYTEAK